MTTSLNRDLEDAYDAYNSKQLIYDINQRKTEAARQNLEISTEKYRNGTINSFDFRVVQNNHLLAAIQELQSVYNLLDSRVTLMRLTGEILESYIEN
jgi:outer membrane protein